MLIKFKCKSISKYYLTLFALGVVSTAHSGDIGVNNGAPFGTWRSWSKCPPNSFAIGFRVRLEAAHGRGFDDSALNAVRLLCRSLEPGGGDTWISSHDGVWGEWLAPVVASTWLTGFTLKVEPSQGGGDNDDTALNEVAFYDANGGQPHYGGGGPWGDWGNAAFCPPGEYINGILAKFEDTVGSGDDTALNDIQVSCAGGATYSGPMTIPPIVPSNLHPYNHHSLNLGAAAYCN